MSYRKPNNPTKKSGRASAYYLWEKKAMERDNPKEYARIFGGKDFTEPKNSKEISEIIADLLIADLL